jgi:hypothetical protein
VEGTGSGAAGRIQAHLAIQTPSELFPYNAIFPTQTQGNTSKVARHGQTPHPSGRRRRRIGPRVEAAENHDEHKYASHPAGCIMRDPHDN